jgi:hypothetical protein
MKWWVFSEASLDAGLTPRPDAGVTTSTTDQGHKEPPEPQVALIEGPSDAVSAADDDTWWPQIPVVLEVRPMSIVMFCGLLCVSRPSVLSSQSTGNV